MRHSKEFIQIVEGAKRKVREIDCDELYSELDSQAVIFDVREDSEWQISHLPNAIHLSKGIIERDIHKEQLKKEDKIILYCSGGYRSLLAAENLLRMGYSNVFSLKGGFKEWCKLKHPTTS